MKLSKVILAPAAALAISALSLASCSANKPQSTVQSEPPRTETVIKQAPNDTFEKQQTEEENERETPWWECALRVIGFLAFSVACCKFIYSGLEKLTDKDLENLD